jgi:peroxiredoxin family protein
VTVEEDRMAEDNAKSMAIVVAESTFDKAMMPFMLAVSGAAAGMEVHVFFTFFGLSILKKRFKPRLPGLMAPFTFMMERKMKRKGVPSLEELRQQAVELSVNLYGCSTSMALMGVTKDALIEGTRVVGAAAFLALAAKSDVQLFIG